MHRLDQIVGNLEADGFAQRRIVLALRDHHDRHGGVDRADLGEQLEPAAAGHLLVEQDYAVRLAPQQGEGIVTVRRLLDGKALPLEEAAVCRETFDFIVHPQNALGTRHRCQAKPDWRRRATRG